MDVLSVWDYVVFGLFLLISLSIGIFYRFSGGRQKTLQEYMLANGEMTPMPVIMSLMTSFISAVTILGTSSENYLFGTQYLLLNFAYVIGTPIVNRVYLPVFFQQGQRISVYQYLDRRFGTLARIAGAGAFTLQMTLYMGVVLYAPSMAVSAVTGMNKDVAIWTIGLTCALYSSIGGIKAVLVTDLVQGILMFIAVYAVIVKGLLDVGSINQVLSSAYQSNRIEFFNFDIDPTTRHTVWGTLIGGLFTFLSLHAVNQAQIQTLRTLKSIKTAQVCLMISSIFVVILSFSVGFIGLIMALKYENCDPLSSKRICKSDQLIPLFVLESFKDYQGLTGLFIAGLMSGSLSTISTAINSIAAVSLEDFLQPILKYFQINLSPAKETVITKAIALVIGVSSIGMAFVAAQFTSVLTAAMTIFGVVGGPILGLFTLGMLVPKSSEKPAVSAFLLAISFGMWISFGQPRPSAQRIPPSGNQTCDISESSSCPSTSPVSDVYPEEYFYLYRISYLWYSLIGFTITVLLGSLLSLLSPQQKPLHIALLSPILSKFHSPKNLSQENISLKAENCSNPSKISTVGHS